MEHVLDGYTHEHCIPGIIGPKGDARSNVNKCYSCKLVTGMLRCLYYKHIHIYTHDLTIFRACNYIYIILLYGKMVSHKLYLPIMSFYNTFQ